MPPRPSAPLSSLVVSGSKSGDDAEDPSRAAAHDGGRKIFGASSTFQHSSSNTTKKRQGVTEVQLRSESTNYRFEALPDCLLSEILCRLPIKKAFETRLLSRRWSHLCTEIPILDFSTLPDNNNPVQCIHRLLSLYKGRTIHTLSISIDYEERYAPIVNSWMEFAVKLKVKELHLALWHFGEKYFPLPSSVIHTSSLTVLKLKGCIAIGPCNTLRLASLKELILFNEGMNTTKISNILAGCPCLNTLRFSSTGGPLKILDIRKQLRSLSLRLWPHIEHDKVDIDTPGLETLQIYGCLPPGGIRIKAESLATLKLKLGFDLVDSSTNFPRYHDVLVQLLLQVSHAKDVSLCSSCVQTIARWGGKCLSNSVFTASKLRLETSLLSTRGLCRLLEIFEKIEYLYLLLYVVDVDYCKPQPYGWRLQDLPVSSVLQHLKILDITELLGRTYDENRRLYRMKVDKEEFLMSRKDEIEMVKFFLENSKVLERMNMKIDSLITCTKAEKQKLISCLCQILNGFDKASPNVTINVD